MFSKNLSGIILSICNFRELTYETASELCNLSSRYIGTIERGQTAPSVNTLEKLCTGLERTPNELLGVTTADEELSYRIAKKVMHYRKLPYLGGSFTTFPVCPCCNCDIEHEYQPYCGNCGQKLAWEHYAHATLFTEP